MVDHNLNNEEQDLEDSLEFACAIHNEGLVKKQLVDLAVHHVRHKKLISIRVSEHDLEVMKLKASRLGVPYQTYINMVIHKDASHQS